jgi:hypothetical protein
MTGYVLLLTAGPSCVLPEGLDVVDDTEINYPPAVVSSVPPASLKATIDGQREFSLTLEDMNLKDTLFVRFFLDYYAPPTTTGPAAPIDLIDVPPPTDATPRDGTRLPITVSIACIRDVPADGKTHVLTAVIADRPFINDNVQPLFRHLPDDARQAEVSWEVACQ